MSNRPILSGTPTVEVDQDRYDELLHKEAQLDIILGLVKKGAAVNLFVVQSILELSEGKSE